MRNLHVKTSGYKLRLDDYMLPFDGEGYTLFWNADGEWLEVPQEVLLEYTQVLHAYQTLKRHRNIEVPYDVEFIHANQCIILNDLMRRWEAQSSEEVPSLSSLDP